MAVLKDGEILLYGFVGESYFDQGFTSVEVLDALAEIGRDTDVTVRINSGGGYVHEGFAVYNALTAHKGKVTVQIDSIAASSASLIAMAGEKITMRPGSLMMIHDPSGFTAGTVEDHRKAVSALERWAISMADVYAERSGKEAADVRATMKDELWMTADEAVAEGYADEAVGKKAQTASAFDYRLYAKAPARLTALAATKEWTAPKATGVAEPVTPTREAPVADITQAAHDAAVAAARAEAIAADRARSTAIMTAEAAKGREALAKHLAYSTDMTAEAAIAALAAAPAAAEPAPVVIPAPAVPDPAAEAAAFAEARSGVAGLANAAAPTADAAKTGWAKAAAKFNAAQAGK